METNTAAVIPFNPAAGDQQPGAEEGADNGPFPATSPLYFPVESRPVSVGNADGGLREADAYQAVVRTDTNEILGIHAASYKVVANEPLFRGFDDALRSSDLDLEGLKIEDHVNYGGRRVIRHYRIPTVRAEPRVNDIVEMRISVINSFDCGNAFSAQVSGLRLWCLNGAVTQHGSASVYGRHTSGFDNSRALEKVAEAIERYMLVAGKWDDWAEREIGDIDAAAALEAFPDANPTLLNRLQNAWDVESGHAGKTVWALYNATTRWSTHTPVRTSSEPNKASIVLDRERRVRQFMRSQAFKKLAA